eukprot:911073_1
MLGNDDENATSVKSTYETVVGRVKSVPGYAMTSAKSVFDWTKANQKKTGGILLIIALIAFAVFRFVYKGEGDSHAVPMDAPAGAKVCRDVTTLMADNGFTNYTLKQNFVEFGGEMILACPHRETEGDITITCSEEGEIALVNNQCLATDECS